MTFQFNQTCLRAGIALIALPIVAACAPETAQTPVETPATQPSPITPSPDTTAPTTTTDTNDVVGVITNNPSLSTLTTAITAAGLTEDLAGNGPYTIFAPSDQAFAALPVENQQQLLQPENQDALRQLLTYHVVADELTSDQLSTGQVSSLEGTPLNVSVDQANAQVQINNAVVTQADIPASNGVVHIVDQVILPPNVSLE
jgi:uncharacterized surface protein with fasciclin (FAS1) repeats